MCASSSIALPAYSYDLNPIEKAFSKVKALLRRYRRFSEQRPRAALAAALSLVSARDAHARVLPELWLGRVVP